VKLQQPANTARDFCQLQLCQLACSYPGPSLMRTPERAFNLCPPTHMYLVQELIKIAAEEGEAPSPLVFCVSATELLKQMCCFLPPVLCVGCRSCSR
jgi:hypothetical protein